MTSGARGNRRGGAGRALLLLVPLVALGTTSPPASAQRDGRPTLHEPIAPDPRDDAAHGVALEGELTAAIRTPRGVVAAPDPARPVNTASAAPYSAAPSAESPGATFKPDRDTRRPDALPYDDPFSPSTAPFKRLSAYDAVDANYTLSVTDPHTTQLAVTATPPDAAAEYFFADMVVDLAAGRKVRIPSVGPGARVLRARAGVGSQDVRVTLSKDGAENWFVEGETSTRARLVMELAIPRAAFGGEFGHPTRAELLAVPALPPNVQRAAAEVAKKIGVSPRGAPHDVVTKLVGYFRAFRDSEDPPTSRGDVYLDLALEQKGVCRHRAFAFLVTALYLGIPTRMISNEAHAWVEVHDGHGWRRIDLGGAGRMLHDPLSTNVSHEPPPDAFGWPQGSTRGEELADRARRERPPGTRGTATGQSSSTSGATGQAGTPAVAVPGGSAAGAPGGLPPGGLPNDATGGMSADARPVSAMTMTLAGADARRGAALPVHGSVQADGAPCGFVQVEIVLRAHGSGGRGAGDLVVGTLATDEQGNFDGAIVLPPTIPLGDYEAHARTVGNSRCGRGQTR